MQEYLANDQPEDLALVAGPEKYVVEKTKGNPHSGALVRGWDNQERLKDELLRIRRLPMVPENAWASRHQHLQVSPNDSP